MALEGTLQDMSLSDLFQVFRIGSKTGVLLLKSGIERGAIYVAAGRAIDAILVRGMERTVKALHEEAVIQMLLWDDATFVFEHDPGVARYAAVITHDAAWMVMEGMRRRDDPLRALPYYKITPDTQIRLAPLPNNTGNRVSLSINQWRVLSRVASSPNLRAIRDATGIPLDQVFRVVAEMVAIGLVEVVEHALPRARPPHHSPVAALTLVEAARPALAPAAHTGNVADPRPDQQLLDAIIERIREL